MNSSNSIFTTVSDSLAIVTVLSIDHCQLVLLFVNVFRTVSDLLDARFLQHLYLYNNSLWFYQYSELFSFFINRSFYSQFSFIYYVFFKIALISIFLRSPPLAPSLRMFECAFWGADSSRWSVRDALKHRCLATDVSSPFYRWLVSYVIEFYLRLWDFALLEAERSVNSPL